MSKRSYTEAVVNGLRAVRTVDVDFSSCTAGGPPTPDCRNNSCAGTAKKKIYVRLLLSIDRRESTEAAIETVGASDHLDRFLSLNIAIVLIVGYLLTSSYC